MTEKQFKNLKKGDRVRYNRMVVEVRSWLEPEYMVEWTNGTNTKISDPWLSEIKICPVL